MFALLASFALIQDRPATLDLTILHTNDVHGHMFPFAYVEVGKSKVEMPSVGGDARRATLIRRLKASIHNPVIVVDSGDTFTPGPLTNADEGIADIEGMNAICYEIACIGNNEFKAKDAREQGDAAGAQAALLRVVKRSRFPWVCANAKAGSGSFLEGVQPYVVRELGGVRVGFLGSTAPRSANYPQTKGWTISDPIATAQEWIPKARADCDILIAMTHIGVELDLPLVMKTHGLDAVVGGDSHTFLYKALEIKNTDGVKVPIVQDGEFGANLGRFDLHFERGQDGTYHLKRYEYRLIPVGPDIPEAPDVVAKLEPYLKPMLEVVGVVPAIGKTPEERSLLTAGLVAEAMRSDTGSDVGLCTTTGLFNVLRHTAVTKYDLWAAMPFKDNVAVAEVKGSVLQKLAAMPIVGWAGPKQLQADRTYKVAMVDFEAGSAFKLEKASLTETDLDEREAVIQFFGSPSRRGGG
jgi:2',3'-cyclic-nucleotide 2'-phosphodiesterase (5'-nucleotidase family)